MRYLVLLSALLISLCSSAQNHTADDQDYPTLKFGILDASRLTVEQILANPKLTCKEPNCEVMGYVLRISRRVENIYGPYAVNGNELPDNIKNLLKHIDVWRGYLDFDEIRVKYNGKIITLPYEYVMMYYR